MLMFIQQPQGLARADLGGTTRIPEDAIWIDLLEPTPEGKGGRGPAARDVRGAQ